VSQYLTDHLSVYVKNIEHSLSLQSKSQSSGRERILEERLLKRGAKKPRRTIEEGCEDLRVGGRIIAI